MRVSSCDICHARTGNAQKQKTKRQGRAQSTKARMDVQRTLVDTTRQPRAHLENNQQQKNVPYGKRHTKTNIVNGQQNTQKRDKTRPGGTRRLPTGNNCSSGQWENRFALKNAGCLTNKDRENQLVLLIMAKATRHAYRIQNHTTRTRCVQHARINSRISYLQPAGVSYPNANCAVPP